MTTTTSSSSSGTNCLHLKLFRTKSLRIPSGRIEGRLQFCHSGTYLSTVNNASRSLRRHSLLLNRSLSSKFNKRFLVYCADNYSNVEAPPEHSSHRAPIPDGGADEGNSVDASVITEVLKPKPKMFKNRFLNFVRLGSVVNNAAESFFKSEIRRRLFVTAVLIVMSRIGYFIPLPGFDRRLIPENYLSFVSGSVDELGDLTAELKLSLFQLGISPQIGASILMQVLCHLVPSLVKLRKEGLDGHEKIKSYMCV